MARRGASEDPKVAALREARCLNPHPEDVTDEAFRSQEFFDARDAVQAKYETVRLVRVDGDSATAAATAFGYSRPSYYEAAAALDEQGWTGCPRWRLRCGRPNPLVRPSRRGSAGPLAARWPPFSCHLGRRFALCPVQGRCAINTR